MSHQDDREQRIAEVVERLASEYQAFVLNREDDADAYLEQIRAQLEESETEGAGGGVGAVGMRRFLEQVEREE